MRICLTHMRHAQSGGTELYLNHLAAYLCDRGHDVTIVCRSHGALPHPRARFVVLRDFALNKAWRMWAFARSVERHLRNTPYDVVVGLGKTWSQDVLRLGGGSHSSFLHSMKGNAAGGHWLSIKDRIALNLERRALLSPECRKIVANSDMVRRDVIERYGLPPERVQLIYNGVDLKRFHPEYRERQGLAIRQAAGLGPEHLVFLFLGNGYKRKGLDLLIEAFPAVLAKFPQARLVVAGRDSDLPGYRARARRLGCGKSVLFMGSHSHPEYCYGAADVYVLPTLYDPFAFSVLEALACGLPVVTTTACGAGELIKEGKEGSVLDLGHDGRQRLASTLISWCDPDRIRKAGIAARKLAEKHDINSKLAEMEKILMSLDR